MFDLIPALTSSVTALGTALTAVLLWTAKRHMDEDKEKHGSASDRLGELERNRVTQSDLASIERQVSRLRTEVTDNHAEILKLLIKLSE